MRIGFDFDNTIVCYEHVFHTVALEKKLIPPTVAPTKLAVREYLRDAGNEDGWTELQAFVYGKHMDMATAFPGVLKTMRRLVHEGHELNVISHKTKHPYMGPEFDLRAAARRWIDTFLRDEEGILVPVACVYFQDTKPEKISTIARIHCDVFIDDLPEILMADDFPAYTQAVLFDPDGAHSVPNSVWIMRSWHDLGRLLSRREGGPE